MTPSHYIPESSNTGYVMNPQRGFLSVIVPEATENIIENPSAEFDFTGWTPTSAMFRNTTWQTSGAYCIGFLTGISNGGGYYTQTVVTNTQYTWSLDFKGYAGVKYLIRVVNGGTTFASKPFIGTGFTQHLSVGFISTGVTTVNLYVQNNADNRGAYLWVDSMQLEAKAYETTYSDGEQDGCSWRGGPHASASSRTGQSRAGGRIRRLDYYGLQVLGISGLDMPQLQNQESAYAVRNGSEYLGYKVLPRQIIITGIFGGSRYDVVQRKKRDLLALFKPDATGTAQPIRFRYHAFDGTRPIGEELEFDAVYTEGLEGAGDSLYGERVAIRFTLYDPNLRSVRTYGEVLDEQDYFHAHWIAGRINGQWNNMGAPTVAASADVHVMKIGPDGKLYIGGGFKDWGGAGNDYIVRYNFVTQAWENVGAPGSGTDTVYDICWGPTGYMYLVGNFHAWGALPNANHVVYFDGTNYQSVNDPTGVIGIYGCVVDRENQLWVVGNFTNLGGIAGANGIAKWNGVWNASLNCNLASVWTVELGTDGLVYVGMDNVGSGAIKYVARRISSGVWEQVGTGINNTAVRNIAFSPDGVCYIAGNFTTAGGYTVQSLAKLNGEDWVPLGSTNEQLPVTTYIFDVAFDSTGNLYVVYRGAGVLDFSAMLCMWNGFSWVTSDLYTAAAVNLKALAIDNNGNIFIAPETVIINTEEAAGITNHSYGGSAHVSPVVTMLGPGIIYTIANETTNDRLWFDSLTLQATERAILYLGNNPSFLSAFFNVFYGKRPTPATYSPRTIDYLTGPGRGDMISTISRGSSISSFGLLTGSNKISCLVGASDSNTQVAMYYKRAYWGVQDASGVK